MGWPTGIIPKRKERAALTLEERQQLVALGPKGAAMRLRISQETYRELAYPHGVATVATVERVKAALAEARA